ncbi:MAG: transglutaminase domain-containing protein [bacterium]
MFKQAAVCLGMFFFLIANTLASGWNGDSLARSIPAWVTGTPSEFATYLKENFLSEEERVRALYTWLGYSISYDLSLIGESLQYENMEEFILYTLKTKKAVCQGYAEVFTAVCNSMDIKALTVHGYNRIDGNIRTDPGHAWNLAKIDGKWALFDPTWGSGYLDDGKYRRSFSYSYFMTPPDTLLETHMPLDPIWQLKDYPVTHDQYLDGKTRGSVYYNYSDSLDLYFSQDEIERAENSLRRAWLDHADQRTLSRIYQKFCTYVENIECNEQITRYNEASTLLQSAIDKYNEYQDKRTRRNSDPAQQKANLASTRALVNQAVQKSDDISPCRSLLKQEIQRLIRQIQEVDTAIKSAQK